MMKNQEGRTQSGHFAADKLGILQEKVAETLGHESRPIEVIERKTK